MTAGVLSRSSTSEEHALHVLEPLTARVRADMGYFRAVEHSNAIEWVSAVLGR